jgi:hypothetical protein
MALRATLPLTPAGRCGFRGPARGGRLANKTDFGAELMSAAAQHHAI